jgi:hypothetical protein
MGPMRRAKIPAERVRDEQMAVGDDLQPVGVVHGVVRDQKHF